jgi:hypothetical protein
MNGHEQGSLSLFGRQGDQKAGARFRASESEKCYVPADLSAHRRASAQELPELLTFYRRV